MSREELIDTMVTDVMEDFDFETVHQVMVNLDWEWDIGNGEMTIPSTYRMMKTADRLLRKAASHYGEKNAFCTGTGGFLATLDGECLTLQFILRECSAFKEDYINQEQS